MPCLRPSTDNFDVMQSVHKNWRFCKVEKVFWFIELSVPWHYFLIYMNLLFQMLFVTSQEILSIPLISYCFLFTCKLYIFYHFASDSKGPLIRNHSFLFLFPFLFLRHYTSTMLNHCHDNLQITPEMLPPLCALKWKTCTTPDLLIFLDLSLLTKSSLPLEVSWPVVELRLANFMCKAGFWCFRT